MFRLVIKTALTEAIRHPAVKAAVSLEVRRTIARFDKSKEECPTCAGVGYVPRK